MGHNESSAKKKIQSTKCPHKETGDNNANILKRSRRQEIIKLWLEINQLETKRTIQRIKETKSWFFEKSTK